MADEVLIEGISPTDYAVLMKDVLIRIKDNAEAINELSISNLADTALDYLFYLEDNRRVVI